MPPHPSPACGAAEIRPRVGFKPNRPQHEAGMRMEPPPSVAWAAGTMPAATAAAAPPDEPPVVQPRSHGLRDGPNNRGSVVAVSPNSGVFVLPMHPDPRSAQPSHEAGVDGGHGVGEQARAVGGRQPGHVAVQVLQEVGHPGERALGRRHVGLAAGDHRVHDRVAGLQPRLRRLEHLGRRHRPGPDQLGQPHRVERLVVEAHAHPPSSNASSGLGSPASTATCGRPAASIQPRYITSVVCGRATRP